ncbi:MAG: hypothetical protein JKY60_18230 [Kordiimonadaceae bacterium]|nr:hypothetical protein [Kordiimonadaceae bacterium]
MYKDQVIFLVMGMIAGTFLGGSIFLWVFDFYEIEASAIVEGGSTLLAAMLAVFGIGWQMSKARLQDRENHQYQILYKHRSEFRDLRHALCDRQQLITLAYYNRLR